MRLPPRQLAQTILAGKSLLSQTYSMTPSMCGKFGGWHGQVSGYMLRRVAFSRAAAGFTQIDAKNCNFHRSLLFDDPAILHRRKEGQAIP